MIEAPIGLEVGRREDDDFGRRAGRGDEVADRAVGVAENGHHRIAEPRPARRIKGGMPDVEIPEGVSAAMRFLEAEDKEVPGLRRKIVQPGRAFLRDGSTQVAGDVTNVVVIENGLPIAASARRRRPEPFQYVGRERRRLTARRLEIAPVNEPVGEVDAD